MSTLTTTVTVMKPEQDASQSVETGKVTKTNIASTSTTNVTVATIACGFKQVTTGTTSTTVVTEGALENKNNSLQITVDSTSAADKTIKIKAGDKYPNKVLGDCDVIITAPTSSAETQPNVILLDDISRFENRDGSVKLEFPGGFTGNVWAVAKRAGLKPVD